MTDVTVTLSIIFSVLVVSSFSLIGAITLFLKLKEMNKILLTLVSLSAGTMFGGALLHLLPEAVEESGGFTIKLSLLVLSGIILFFLLEKAIHLKKCRNENKAAETCECSDCHPPIHSQHKHHLGIMNLVGDGLHNLIDGLIIAAAYLTDFNLGIATTIAVILHEVPQEIGDFGVLIYSGFSRGKALFFNFLSAAIAVLGAVIGIVLGSGSEEFVQLILPLAAGGFIYIAGSNLVPELHKECGVKESIWHGAALLLGIGLMLAMKIWGGGV
jgi:zinc and cadmium transporter